jgi:hypothetical protein
MQHFANSGAVAAARHDGQDSFARVESAFERIFGALGEQPTAAKWLLRPAQHLLRPGSGLALSEPVAPAPPLLRWDD